MPSLGVAQIAVWPKRVGSRKPRPSVRLTRAAIPKDETCHSPKVELGGMRALAVTSRAAALGRKQTVRFWTKAAEGGRKP